MADLPPRHHGQNRRGSVADDRLATMSSDTLLVAADALRALGAEIDSEEIEMWVARQAARQHVHQHNPRARHGRDTDEDAVRL